MGDQGATVATTITLNYRIDCWRDSGHSSPYEHFSITGADQADCDRQANQRYDIANTNPASSRLGLELVEVVKPAVAEVLRRITSNNRENGETY